MGRRVEARTAGALVSDKLSHALRPQIGVLGEGVLLDEFPSKAVFDHCVRWSKGADHNVFVWSKPWDNAGGGGLLFVTAGA